MSDSPNSPQRPSRRSSRRPTEKNRPSVRLWRFVKGVFTAFLVIAALGLITGYGILYYFLLDRPSFNPDTLGSLQATSFIYDKDGNLITPLHGEQNRIPVTLDKIPPVLQQAILAAEDLRFYEHQGVDVKAVARAFLTNVQDGRYSQGASTITQQLVKNAFLTTEKTIKRKIHEAYLAYQLESTYTKKQILEMYLNRIYFGHGAYGVQAAAQTYFGKDVSELQLAEAALLAGMPRRPTFYSPISNSDAAVERRNYILSLMAKNDLADEVEVAEAKKKPLPRQLHGFDQGQYPFSAFVDYVIEELSTHHGLAEDQIFRGGLKIYTSLDPEIQQRIEAVLNDDSFYPPGPADQPVQAAMAVINHKTGEIKGLGGGRNYDGRRSFNRATQLRRQPGSVVKPIMVYAPAMEKGYSPEDILVDEPTNFNGYAPENYDGQYRGPVTIREAVANSINVPAVYLFKLIGPEAGIQFAKSVGLPLAKEDRYLSLALGGLTQGVSPLHMAGAYTSFANLGVYVQSHAVTRIIDAQGNVRAIEPVTTQAISSLAAYRMTEMLMTAVQSGTGYRAQMRRPVAGKTGTTELPQLPEFHRLKGNKDAWFVGYTPELTCAVWMGYDRTDAKHYLKQIYGGSYPAQMFRSVLSDALRDTPVQPFPRPADYAMARAGKYLGPENSPYSPKSLAEAEAAQQSREREQQLLPSDGLNQTPTQSLQGGNPERTKTEQTFPGFSNTKDLSQEQQPVSKSTDPSQPRSQQPAESPRASSPEKSPRPLPAPSVPLASPQ